MLLQEKEKLEDKWFTVDGLRLHTSFVANGSDKKSLPIVLVCGLGVSSSYMIPTALRLAKDADVYCPNLPGFGKSSKPTEVLDVSELSNSLIGFMHESKIERAVLVGHSFGCQIAAEFALRHPEKLESLVLAAPTGNPDINSAFRYFGRLILDVPREPLSLIPLAIRDYLRAGLLRIWKTFKFALQDRFEDKITEIQTNTLVIRGTKDPIVSQRWAEKVAKLLPKGNLVSVKDAGHAVNYNSPDEFAFAIREFLL
jgi:2-hydroxy-6-oxonona-2,4-dienedioate hydrolase